MNQHFQLTAFMEFPQYQSVFFSEYLKKHNEKVEVDEPICIIRIGKYNSAFRYTLKTIKSPKSGFLIYNMNIDDAIHVNDNIFSISSQPESVHDLNVGETFDHHFSGESLVYKFEHWFKKDSSYVTIGDPIYSFSNVRSNNRIHYAERSGKISIKEIKTPFLSKNQTMYSIRYSEPFQFEEIYETVENSCYVYLMKDFTNAFYKIGISNNPSYREKTLQSEKPSIDLIACKKFPIRMIAESFEKSLHKTFENKRIRGEWFKLEDFEVEYLKKSLE